MYRYIGNITYYIQYILIIYCIINIQLGDSNKLPTSTYTAPPSAELAFPPNQNTTHPHLVDEGECRNTTAHVRNRYCKRCGLFCTTGSTVDQDMCPSFQWKPGDLCSTGDGVSPWFLQSIGTTS